MTVSHIVQPYIEHIAPTTHSRTTALLNLHGRMIECTRHIWVTSFELNCPSNQPILHEPLVPHHPDSPPLTQDQRPVIYANSFARIIEGRVGDKAIVHLVSRIDLYRGISN